MNWEVFSSSFHDYFIPWSVIETSHLRFKHLRHDNLPVTGYKDIFSSCLGKLWLLLLTRLRKSIDS